MEAERTSVSSRNSVKTKPIQWSINQGRRLGGCLLNSILAWLLLFIVDIITLYAFVILVADPLFIVIIGIRTVAADIIILLAAFDKLLK